MKNFYLLLAILFFNTSFSQSLPINFEGDIITSDFIDFNGGVATVTTNPNAEPEHFNFGVRLPHQWIVGSPKDIHG